MQYKHIKYSYRVFTGLGIGIVFGAIIQRIVGADSSTTQSLIEWLDIVGLGYVRFLQMLIMPLIFVSLVRAFTEMQGDSNIGETGLNALAVLIVRGKMLGVVGVMTVSLFNRAGAEVTRGDDEDAIISALHEIQTQEEGQTIPQQILSFTLKNILNDLAG